LRRVRAERLRVAHRIAVRERLRRARLRRFFIVIATRSEKSDDNEGYGRDSHAAILRRHLDARNGDAMNV
jgi:hypothetical protein